MLICLIGHVKLGIESILKKAGSDPAQKRITEFYNILTNIEILIESNEELSMMLQNAVTSMHDENHPVSCNK